MKNSVPSSPDDEGEQLNATKFFLFLLFICVFSNCHYSTNPDRPVSFMRPVVYKSAESKKLPQKQAKKKKIIYITFDDGPNKGTRQVLRTIQEEKIPASFFVIGEHVYGSHDQLQIWDSLRQSPWVEIYNHSFTHAHNKFTRFYNNDSTVVADFERCNDSLKLQTKIARTPGRNIWRTATISATDLARSKSAADSLHDAGFTLVGWDLEWHYDDLLRLQQTPDELIRQVDSVAVNGKTKTPGHIVLLTHDQTFADSGSITSLKQFIGHFKTSEDYTLEFVSKYPGVKQ